MQPAELAPDQLVALGAPLPLLPGGLLLQLGAGCVHCRGTGYYGRTGVFEILPINAAIRDAITHEAPEARLVELARGAGMRTLREAAVRKLAQGQTAFAEVMRMTSAS